MELKKIKENRSAQRIINEPIHQINRGLNAMLRDKLGSTRLDGLKSKIINPVKANTYGLICLNGPIDNGIREWPMLHKPA